jgi:ATP-binding cassette subfamily B protein
LVEELAAGWDTVLARPLGGVDLSGGQWQRVALARAFAAAEAGAGILVLDEPTSQLDTRAEAAFSRDFLRNTTGLTTIVISHRLAAVRQADSIAVLAGGVVVEQGSHAELLEAGGTYAELFRLQARRFEDGAAHA